MGCVRLVAQALTWVPPTSMTRIFTSTWDLISQSADMWRQDLQFEAWESTADLAFRTVLLNIQADACHLARQLSLREQAR